MKFPPVGLGAAFLLAFAGSLVAGESPPLDFFAGTYEVVGRTPDTGRPYEGTVEMRARGDHLRWVREVGGRRVKGEARIEPSLCEEIPVLHVRFTDRGRKYETFYLFRSDLDNYPILTGKVYPEGERGEKPGLEALFSRHE